MRLSLAPRALSVGAPSPFAARIARLFLPLCGAMALVGTLFVALGPVHAAPAATIQSWINAAPPGSTINVPDGVYSETLMITKSLTLVGQSTSGTILRPPAGARGIYITPGVTVRIERFTITGGQAPGGVGGGIWVDGGDGDGSHLTLVESAITDSSADYGGGIFQGGRGSARIQASLLEHNRAGAHGGGIYAQGSVFITNTNVISNSASGSGGGLAVWEGNVSLAGGLFADNYAAGNGGGVNANNDVSVSGTQFLRNTAVGAGGGLLQWNAGRAFSMTGARLEANHAGSYGGGIFTRGIATITNSQFYTNTTDWIRPDAPPWPESTGGGAIYATSTGEPETRAGELHITASTFLGNRASCSANNCLMTSGGAIYATRLFTHTIDATTFERNYAWSGGAVSSNPATLIRNSKFTTNSGGYGAAVSAVDAEIIGSSFSGNSVVNDGGALSVGGRLRLERATFTGNTAGAGGGAARVVGDVTAENVLFAGNQSGWKAGAALLIQGNKLCTLKHVTIARPSKSATGPAIMMSGGTLNLWNSMIVSHTQGISLTGGTLNHDYSLYFGNDVDTAATGSGAVNTGTHIVHGDPRFVAPAAGNYHLRPDSPAANAGADLGVSIDLDGEARPSWGGFDIGADEIWILNYLPFLRR